MRVITSSIITVRACPSTMMAQDKVKLPLEQISVSGYIWRGQDLGRSERSTLTGNLLQKVSHSGAWGSVGFESTDTKEFDLTLGYSIGGFSVSKVTDYWFNTQVETGIDDDGETIFATNKYFKYGAHSTAHLSAWKLRKSDMTSDQLAVNWYTNFA